ncbi:MAG: N-acetylmuramoyl-L-alanine amidase [Alphaproteobacteria bacterium]|nr:N-acetylmuramoyl-L-alanine amidase [Alphaproteobacteria bacterium]
MLSYSIRQSFIVKGFMLSLLWVLGGVDVYAASRIQGVVIEQTVGGERLILQSDVPLQHAKLLRLSGPDRVVIDFQTLGASSVVLPPEGSRLVSGIRFGQFDTATSRVVLDLKAPVEEVAVSSHQAGGIVVDLRASASETHAQPVAQPQPATPSQVDAIGAPASPKPPAYDAVQDEKPLIVIDAGHGGQDPGAIGAQKTYEKNVTLAMARTLRQALLRTGRYRVALTRDSDTFIMLGERVNIARKLKADMFISLHADSNPRPDAKGFSIYTISDTASDEEAAALAKRENAVDDLSGMDLGDVDKDVADILIDLAARETKTKSAQLADIIVEAMHPKITKLTKPHRYAGFRVLKAPDIPSVLIELGFLTNEVDEKLLQSQEYRELVTASIAKGIDAYYVTIKRR